MSEHYSLYRIHSEGDFKFSPSEYSKFKFGDKNVSRKFGFALATGFIREYLPIHPIDNQIVIASSPYDFIPTATFAMKNYFVQKLNDHLVDTGKPVVQEVKIHRTVTYKEDYGTLSAEDRMKLIGNDQFHMDYQYVEGKTIIFMDDIRITGSHEKMIRSEILSKVQTAGSGKDRAIFVYFAELINPAVDPKIENYLNYYSVSDLYSLDKVLKNEDWIPNTRAIKFILRSENGALFDIFISFQPLKILQTVYHLAIGNSYHLMDDYRENIGKIKKILSQNKLL